MIQKSEVEQKGLKACIGRELFGKKKTKKTTKK